MNWNGFLSRRDSLRIEGHLISSSSLSSVVHFFLCITLPIGVLGFVPMIANAGQAGDFNAAPFGNASVFTNDQAQGAYAPALVDGKDDTAVDLPSGGAVQVEWRQPRDVYAVRLLFAGRSPQAQDVELKYWYHIWPDNGGGGWMKVDDPFNGGFVTAAVNTNEVKPNQLKFRFKPLEKTENPKITETGFDWRTTYRIRVSFKSPVRLAGIECLTDSRWKESEVKIELVDQDWNAHLDARNARIISASLQNRSSVVVKVQYADNPQRLSPDRGYIIVRRDGKGVDFSFFVDDVLREGAITVRDIKAFISDASKNLSYATFHKSNDIWDATVMEKVSAMPEQTFEQATKAIPPKWISEAHLGLPALRQEISQNASSQIYTDFISLRGPGQDVDRSPKLSRDQSQRQYTLITRTAPFGPPGPKSVTRWLEEGYLPIIHSRWQHESISYCQSVFVTALDRAVLRASLASPEPPENPMGHGTQAVHREDSPRAANFGLGLSGDEPVVALSRLEIKNMSKAEQTATFWLKISGRPPMTISPDGLLLLAAPTKPPAGEGLTPVWGQIDIHGKGELSHLKDYLPAGKEGGEPRDVIRYTVRLAPDEKYAIDIKIPYIEQMTAKEIAQLKALDWDQSRAEMTKLWKKRLARAINDYLVPEPALMNLYRANLWHVLITTDRDPSTGLYEHGASTCGYPMYANETMMVARSLEMRGEHEEARRLIEPYLVSQGTRALPGNFKSKDGLLYAAAPKGHDYYTAQGYNMHHGFILWAAAEHYFWTRDNKYLETIAPNLIAACDWITRERKATEILNPDGTKPIEWGLAPAGDLEDVDEYLYWYTTNAYYYRGMKTAADALAAIHHPEAARLTTDAQNYANDIMASVRESVATSPVVKLLDGSYIPFVPPRAYVVTDLKEGWIRESLYCALHLVDCGLIKPDDPLATWILHDLEDRIFMSSESGYGPKRGLKNPKEQFFSFGGFNPQPNLLDNSIAYLKRGQIANFVRAFFNIYAASIYPDVNCFAEAVITFGEGDGPLYKTPDESKFIQWMRQMLILETGNDLWLGRGVPRVWMADGKSVELENAATYFGPMNLKITSAVASGRIKAEIQLPTRNPARSVCLSLRHPQGQKIKSVKVNGRDWRDFDPATDSVTIPGTMGKVSVVAAY